MKAQHLESAIQGTLSGDSSCRAEAVENFLAELLAMRFGLRSRATDGYMALREDVTATSYFSVGKLWMVDDQSSNPVSLQLIFDPSGDLTSGVVHFGLGSVDALKELSPNQENTLLAFPREATLDFEWACILENHSGAWGVRQPAAEQAREPDAR